jgi:hypothetical protein
MGIVGMDGRWCCLIFVAGLRWGVQCCGGGWNLLCVLSVCRLWELLCLIRWWLYGYDDEVFLMWMNGFVC